MRRREILQGISWLGLGPMLQEQKPINHPVLLALQLAENQPTPAEIDTITAEFLDYGKESGGDSTVGPQLVKPYRGIDDFLYFTGQRAMLQMDPSGKIETWNTVENLSDLKYQGLLQSSKLKIVIPNKVILPQYVASSFDKRVELFEISTQFVEFVNTLKKMGFDPGMPVGRVVDYKTKDGQVVYSLLPCQKVLLQLWNNGGQEIVLMGEMLKQENMLPKQVLLPAPKPIDLPPGLNQEGLACSAGMLIGEGIASWYGKESCTNPKCQTANGEIFNEWEWTIAVPEKLRRLMGKHVKVTNLLNGISAIVWVNDIMGQPGRIADLGIAVERLIGGQGLTPVRLELVNCA